MSYEARALGVLKHIRPHEVASRFGATVTLVHAFTIGGMHGKVSYRRYRPSTNSTHGPHRDACHRLTHSNQSHTSSFLLLIGIVGPATHCSQ